MSGNRITVAALAVCALWISFMIGAGVQASTSAKVSTSCMRVVEMDNRIFSKTGNALGNVFDTQKMNDLSAYVRDNTSQRTAWVAECAGK